MSSEYDYLSKVIFIGPSQAGKSGVLLKATDNRFIETYEQTIGVEFGTIIVTVTDAEDHKDKKIKLQIWDTAGNEKFRSITKSYYRGAQVVCIMWDAAELPEDHLKSWFEEAKRQAADDAPIVFVRPKKDRDAEKGITPAIIDKKQAEIKKFAGDNAIFFDVSAKTGENVTELLQKVAELALPLAKADEANLQEDNNEPRQAIHAPESPGRLERMSHSRTVREAHLNQDGLDKDWLKLHLLSVEQNCRTARTIREKLDGDLELVDTEKYAPVLELLRELDSDERALKYKLCIFFTPESYSTRVVAERNQEVRQVILDVAFRLFNMAKSEGWQRVATSAQDLYGDLPREQVPEKVRDILERQYQILRPSQLLMDGL